MSSVQIRYLTRSILLVLHIKKYDYMHMAVIHVYTSIYTHIYVELKASSCPGVEGKAAALASRKPLAPEDKNGNKTLRRNAPPRRINRDVISDEGDGKTVINHHVASINKGREAVINRDIKRDTFRAVQRWSRRTQESKIRLRQQKEKTAGCASEGLLARKLHSRSPAVINSNAQCGG